MSKRARSEEQTPAWKALQAHFDGAGGQAKMRDLFEADGDRFKKFRYDHY